ncbi:hypothetical protein BHE74_00012549 [Ensete ventricosum]|nr:hypothetical protein BHE74_00012549 [Ensete ventricosum]
MYVQTRIGAVTACHQENKAFDSPERNPSNADLAAKSSHPRTARPPTWPTRRSWSTGCTKDVSCRTADLAQVRSAPPTCKRTPHHQNDRHGERHDDMVKGATA